MYLSVADPGCLSRILIFTHPGSRIQKQQQKREVKKIFDVKPFYVITKFNKIVKYFSFEVLKKKIWANFQRILGLFTKKIVKKLFKIWSWDQGSEIRDPEKTIPDPGVKKVSDPGSGTATLVYIHPPPFSFFPFHTPLSFKKLTNKRDIPTCMRSQ